MDDLPGSKDDCAEFKVALDQYQITDAGPGDIYRIEDNPSGDHKDAVLLSIKKRLRDNPTKQFLIVFVLVGHGMQQGSRQVLLLNEFDGRSFYKTWSAEADIRELSRMFPNSYSIAFFTSSRDILDPRKLNGFKSKKDASAQRKTPEFMSDMSDEEELKEEVKSASSDARQNVAFFYGCNP